MNAVLISILPKWCELIASGKKTIEVRETRPKLETPFRCYIYCTHGYYRTPREHKKSGDFWVGEPINNDSPGRYWGNGKVIGEFVCDCIDCGWNYGNCESQHDAKAYDYKPDNAATENDGSFGFAYGWHIAELKIYEEPKALEEFSWGCNPWYCNSWDGVLPCDKCQYQKISRPPKSWCYVEEIRDEKCTHETNPV